MTAPACEECWKQIQGTEYRDDEGNPIKLTGTGYYHPYNGWQPGPVDNEFLQSVYDEPYTYVSPGRLS